MVAVRSYTGGAIVRTIFAQPSAADSMPATSKVQRTAAKWSRPEHEAESGHLVQLYRWLLQG